MVPSHDSPLNPDDATSDAELLQRWRDDDDQAGEALFARYYDPLERFFMNKVSSGISDLIQDTFRKCLHARERLAKPDRFRSYLFSIAYNTLRTHLRTQHRHGEHIDFDHDFDHDFDKVAIHALAPGPSSVLVARREQRLLLEGLRRIPMSCQAILELRYWEDLSGAEIAAFLGVETNTARSRLQRARDRLKQALEALAGSPEVLASTLSDLDGWARSCRRDMGREE